MGIDIYMSWKNQTEEEKKSRDAGYLRETYHGGIYPSKHLIAEAFKTDDAIPIDAATLRERLPEVIEMAKQRYSQELLPHAVSGYIQFVELAEKKERETGEPVLIRASQ